MKLLRSILLSSILPILGTFASAQYTYQLVARNITAPNNGTSANIIGSGAAFHNLTWNDTGTIATCSIRVDGSADGVTWGTGDVITAQTCTSNGNILSASIIPNYVRINVVTLTGGGSITANLSGYINNPSGGGGTGTPGGATGSVQTNAGGGNFGGITFSQDCTLNSSTGALTCTKTNNVLYGPLATQAGASASAAIIAGLGFTPENSANKDANSGYAGLTAGALLKIAEFPSFTQFGLLYGSGSSGSPSILSSPATNCAWVVGYNVTASAAVAPTASCPGVPVTAQATGVTMDYTSRSRFFNITGGTTATQTFCQISGTCANNLSFALWNQNSGTLTNQANAADTINSGSTGGTLALFTKWFEFVYSESAQAPGNWDLVRIPTFDAFGSTCTNGLTWSTSTGIGCASSAPLTSAFYQTVIQDSTTETQRAILKLISGSNSTVSCADNSGNNSTDCTFSSTGGGGGSSALAAVTNTTSVTASNPTAATDTQLMELSLAAAYLNTAGQPYRIHGSGVLSTTTASVPQVTITAKLCSVSGCGSGTVTPLAVIQSTALNTTAITNASWIYDITAATVGTGASCNLIVKGSPGLVIENAGSVATADSVYADANTAVSSPNQNCANALFLDFFVQQSTTGASNSYKQLLGSIMPQGGGPVVSVGGQTGAVAGQGNGTKVQMSTGSAAVSGDFLKADANGNSVDSGIVAQGIMLNASCAGGVGTANATEYTLGPPNSLTNTGLCTQIVASSSTAGVPMSHACTVKNLFAQAGTAGSVSGSGLIQFYKNGVVDASFKCTIGTTHTCNDTTHTVSMSAGDLWQLTVKTGQATDALAAVRAAFDCI